MVTLRPKFITHLQGMNKAMYRDLLEINPVSEVDDGFGNTTQGFPHSGKFAMCSIQEVDRIPGTPDTASTTIVIGNFLIKAEAGAVIPQKSQLIATNGDIFQTENVYDAKFDRLSETIYAYRIK